jgi:hypothetical protein
MAGEVINLATFSLDTKKLVDNLSDLQDAYFDLKKEQKSYADQSKEVAKEIEKLEKAQKLLTSAAGDNSEAIEKNEKELQDLLKTQRELFKAEQNTATQMSTVRKELNQTTNQLKAYQDAEAKTKSLIDLGNEALNRQIKNKNDAKAANIALNNVSNQLNPNIAEEAELLKKVNAQIDSNTAFVKENSSETAKQKMNVGNYQSALEGVDAVLEKFGINGQQARTVVQGFTSTVSKASSDIVNYTNSAIQATASTLGFRTSSQLAAQSQSVQTATTDAQAASNVVLATTTEGVAVATATSTIGLKAFTIALASTGIGLIIIALGALFSYLKDLDPLLDKIEQGFAAVGAVVRVLGQAIATLSFDNLGESMSKAASEAIALKEAQQDLADLQNSQEVANAKASQQYDELILKSKNRTLTEKERISFLQQAEKIETANYKQRSALAQAELNNALKAAQIKGQLSDNELKKLQRNTLAYGTYLLNAGKITEAELEGLKKAELGKIAIDAENTKRLEKNQNAQDKLAEDAKNKRDKAEQDRIAKLEKKKQQDEKLLDDLIKNSRTEIDLFVEKQGFKKKSLEEEYNFNKELFDKENKDIELRLSKGKITAKEAELEKEKLKNDFAKKNAELVIDNAELELNAQIEKNQKILDGDKFLSDEQLKIKQQAFADQLKAELEFQAIRLANAEINQAEYNAAIEKINADYEIKKEELAIKKKADDQNKALIDLENKKIANEENFLAQIEIEKEQNKIKLEQELAAAKTTGAETQAIKDKYAELDKEIDQKKRDAQVQYAADTFGNIAQMLGENSKAGKAAAIAQATINTYQGVSAAWMAPAVLPQPFDAISKVVASGIALASGLKAVKEIKSTKSPTIKKPSYATGVIGLRGLGSGTSDNINANLSAGESVINAKSTAMFANELSAINQAGGGVGLNGASNILNQNSIEKNVNNSQLASMIAEAVAIGAEVGTSKGAKSGIVNLSDNRKIMSDAKF